MSVRVHNYSPPMDRLIDRVVLTEEGCWTLTGHVNSLGYPQFKIKGKRVRAHRIAYEFFIAEIPDDMHLHHVCENKCCVNPFHMSVLTKAEHVRHHRFRPECGKCGSLRKIMITRKNGRPGGSRCLDCQKRRQREYNQRRAAA